MRPLCDACESAAARVFCPADEAALCSSCDEKVHGCNKLASRHVRLALAEASAVRHCDICEKAPAFFYCRVDGTSLCLHCDMTVHVGGKKTHERYLLMGQKVELPPCHIDDTSNVPKKEVKLLEARERQHNTHDNGLWKNESSNNSAIAMAVGDTYSQMIDLNSNPHLEHSEANQSVRDGELANGDKINGQLL